MLGDSGDDVVEQRSAHKRYPYGGCWAPHRVVRAIVASDGKHFAFDRLADDIDGVQFVLHGLASRIRAAAISAPPAFKRRHCR
jgi:hypothetical protein